jgi:hypothetical protein
MPTLSFTVTYDGSDSEIIQALSRIGSALGGTKQISNAPQNGHNGAIQPSSTLEKIAAKFAGYISRRKRLKDVMVPWLEKDGKITFRELMKLASVKTEHQYAGIGSALTRNMKKAGGPKDWYENNSQDLKGEWIYEIAAEFVEPLKHAFHLQ